MITGFPYQSNFLEYDTDGITPIYDRAVDSVFYRNFWKAYFRNGIFPNPSTSFQVLSDSGFRLKVKAGMIHVEGITHISDSDITLDIAQADITERTDRIVFRVDTDLNRRGEIIVKKGSQELIRNAGLWELGLADVTVKPGAAQLTQANIKDIRLDSSICGVVAAAVTTVDTQTLFNQYDNAFEQLLLALSTQKSSQQSSWQTQMYAQNSAFSQFDLAYANWFAQVQSSLPMYAGFDFDNQWLHPNTVKETTVTESGVLITLKTAVLESLIAEYTVNGEPDGSITERQRVYDEFSQTTLWERVKTVTFGDTIKEVVV